MSKFIFYFKNYRINLKMNLFITIQLIFMLLILNANISDSMYLRNTAYYCDNIPENMYFLSGATKSFISYGDEDEFFNLTHKLSESPGVLGVGYQLEDGVYIKNKEDIVIPYMYLNKTMCEIQYPLKDGSWFKNEMSDSDEIEIIIGGDIGKYYNIGETIEILSAINVNNKIEYKKANAKIIGILKDPSYVINLGVSASRPTYNNLYDEYKNVILSNSDAIIDYNSTVRYPLGSLTLKLDNNADKDIISKYGQLFSFREIEENSKISYRRDILNKLPSVLIVMSAIIFGLIGTTYLYVYRYMKTVTVYYLNGLSRKKCCNIITSNNIISLFIAIIISILLVTCSDSIKESLFLRNPISIINLVFTLFFALIIIFISNIAAKQFSKDTVYTALRRFQ